MISQQVSTSILTSPFLTAKGAWVRDSLTLFINLVWWVLAFPDNRAMANNNLIFFPVRGLVFIHFLRHVNLPCFFMMPAGQLIHLAHSVEQCNIWYNIIYDTTITKILQTSRPRSRSYLNQVLLMFLRVLHWVVWVSSFFTTFHPIQPLKLAEKALSVVRNKRLLFW